VPIVRSTGWRTAVPTSPKVGDGVRPRFGAPGLARAVSQPAYEQRLAISGTVQVMHVGPNPKVFASTQHQEDP
jgi:hypothetical protein